MMETFSYSTKINSREFHQVVYAQDVNASLDKWLQEIKKLQYQIYSFDQETVAAIQEQAHYKMPIKTTNERDHFISFLIDNAVCITYIHKLDKGQPDFIANIYYLKTSEGGRKTPAVSGYRPQFKVSEKNEMTSAEQIFINRDKVLPGESINAEIRILTKDLYKGLLFTGFDFMLCEGPVIVANGVITDVINNDLKKL